MKILYVNATPDGYGGSSLYMFWESQALRSLGHEVYLLHAPDRADYTRQFFNGSLTAQHIFNQRDYFQPKGVKAEEAMITQFIAEKKIDLLHIHLIPRLEILRHWIRSYPVAVTTHVPMCPNGARYHWKNRCACDRQIGLGCLTVGYNKLGCGFLGNGQPHSLKGFLRSMVADFWQRCVLRTCDRLIAPSEWMKDRLVRDGIPDHIISVLNPPVDRLGVEEIDEVSLDPPVITFVGRVTDFKGADCLLRASKYIQSPHQIWIIGTGTKLPELEELAETLGIADRITYWGRTAPKKVRSLLDKSTIVTVPSLWPETFCMTGPEAMLSRKPVVAHAVGGIPEWLEDGVTGKLVPAGDVKALAQALEFLLQNPEIAQQMGEAGYQKVSRLAPAQHSTQLVHIYQDVLASAKDKTR